MAMAHTTSSLRPSRYESQKRRDWRTFTQYLRAHRPPLALARCSGAHVLEFLRYLDRFGKTKVHAPACPFHGVAEAAAAGQSCQCPLRQAWGSLDALVGRLRAAFDTHGGGAPPEANPFAARAVRLYLRGVRDTQANARGISYQKKRRKGKNRQSSDGMEADAMRVNGNGSAAAAAGKEKAQQQVVTAQPRDVVMMPLEYYDIGSSAMGASSRSGFYLPLLFDTLN